MHRLGYILGFLPGCVWGAILRLASEVDDE